MVTKWIPFSLAEMGLICIPFVILFLLSLWVTRLLIEPGNRRRIFGKGVLNLFCLLSLIFSVLTVCCFMNIRRVGIGEQIGLQQQEAETEELKALCQTLVAKVNRLREENFAQYGNEVFVSQMTFQEKAEEAKTAYRKIAAQYPTLGILETTPKEVHFSRVMSYTNIVGVYVPFTMEANIDTDVPDYNIPKTICHELAHIQGYLKEDEANFIAWLVCRESDNPEFQYSGYMMAMILSTNALYSVNPEGYREVMADLNSYVRNDLDENSAYWREIESSSLGRKVSEAATKSNDTYLKISGQKNGVKSYGMAVDLILADYRTRNK